MYYYLFPLVHTISTPLYFDLFFHPDFQIDFKLIAVVSAAVTSDEDKEHMTTLKLLNVVQPSCLTFEYLYEFDHDFNGNPDCSMDVKDADDIQYLYIAGNGMTLPLPVLTHLKRIHACMCQSLVYCKGVGWGGG